MTLYKPSLVSGDKVPMMVNRPRHLVPGDRHFVSSGAAVLEAGEKTGARNVTRAGIFQDAMLRALDDVSNRQNFASDLIQKAMVEPGSVDAHDVTIAEAKASLSLNITRTVLDRIVRGWRELINTR